MAAGGACFVAAPPAPPVGVGVAVAIADTAAADEGGGGAAGIAVDVDDAAMLVEVLCLYEQLGVATVSLSMAQAGRDRQDPGALSTFPDLQELSAHRGGSAATRYRR